MNDTAPLTVKVTKTTTTEVAFQPDRVKRVYAGKNHKCCCGCSGEYTERTDPNFPAMLGKFEAKLRRADPKQIDADDTYLAVETGANLGRLWIAYYD